MYLKWTLTALLCTSTAFADTSMRMSPAETKYMQDMDSKMKKMDQDMAAPMTGNVDRDFALMMIPHHQGAIDMAKAELTYGKDPSMRKLAQSIIQDQHSEIKLMHHWLDTKPSTNAGEQNNANTRD